MHDVGYRKNGVSHEPTSSTKEELSAHTAEGWTRRQKAANILILQP